MCSRRIFSAILSTIFLFTFFSLALTACSNNSGVGDDKPGGSGDGGGKTQQNALEGFSGIQEDRSVYVGDKPDDLVTLYITVLKSYDKQGKELTIKDLDAYRVRNGGESPALDIIMKEGDENGPRPGSFGYSDDMENAVLESRGHSAQSSSQKSYRIKLYKRAGLWRDQEVINLNKHPFDPTKVRNKLSFDILKLIPDITSLRTFYVHLYIKDTSSEGKGAQYKDMGLYVQVEQPNKRFLRMHGLDSGGQLYKAEMFEFYRYEDKILPADHLSYKRSEFEKILEIKGSEDHTKLIQMLEDVNNPSMDINSVVDMHFDRENYLTWLAVNIVFGNIDVTTQNFYLYSPANGERFYFLPWDYDGAWGYPYLKRNENIYSPWEHGISRFWGSVLHRRFLKDPENVRALDGKIAEIMKTVTRDQAQSLLDSYRKVIDTFLKRPPDSWHLGVSLNELEKEYGQLIEAPDRNVEAFKRSLQSPMPVFLLIPEIKKDKVRFSWDFSYDLQGDDLFYDFQVSRSPSFDHLVVERKGLNRNEAEVERLPEGTYYYRVIIRDSRGNTQVPFDTYQDVDGVRYFGVMRFRVEAPEETDEG